MRWGLQLAALAVFMSLNLAALAQTEVLVLDKEGNELRNAHLTFTGIQDKRKGTIISDSTGRITLPDDVVTGNTTIAIEVAYIGFEKRIDTINREEKLTLMMQEENVTLNQVIITAQYAPNSPDKSIQKIRIIDRKQLESRGVVNLADALQFETGMRLAQDNFLGSSATVQGISGENVKIMIDGVPVIGRQGGNIDLSQINMNNVERIEIVEGPLSVNYGSNALAGTINIITRKDLSHKYNSSVNTYYESVGQYNLDFGLGYHKGSHTISGRLGRNFFDGWSPGEEYSFVSGSTPADSNRNQQWKPKEQYFLNANYIYARKSLSFRIFTDYFHETLTGRGEPRAPYYVSAFDEYFQTRRFSTGVDAGGKWGEGRNWSVLAALNDYNRTRNTYLKDLTTLEEEPGEASLQDTTGIVSLMSRSVIRFIPANKKLSWEAGYDFNYERADGKRIQEGQQDIGDYALFSTAEISRPGNLVIKPGLRYSYNTAYNAPLIPSINLRYAPARTTWRFSYARGFRAPSLKELYLDFVDINHDIRGNTDLRAESSHSTQAGASRKFALDQSITVLEAGLFYNDISNMITLASMGNSTSFTYINVGKYRTCGADFNISQSVNHWKITSGMVYTGRSDYSLDGSAVSDFLFSPEVRAALTYEFKRLGGNITTYYKYNGRLQAFALDESGAAYQRETDAYQMLDLAATKYIRKKRLNWTFGVKNIFDVSNIAASGPGGGVTHGSSSGTMPVSWGRTFFTALKFDLSWN